MPTTSKIVIKIKDVFFLQKKTFDGNQINPNQVKLIIGDGYFEGFNLTRIKAIYPTINDGASEGVFDDLLKLITLLAPSSKLESLFSVIEATTPINLMQMAKDRSDHIGENLLNFYFIEVATNRIGEILNELNNHPNFGIDYAYLRGELVNYEESPLPDITKLVPLFDRNISAKSFNNSTKFIKNQTISEPQINPSSNLQPQSKSNSSSQTPTTQPTIPSISVINNLFKSYGIEIPPQVKELPNVQVVDLEQGFNIANSGISNLGLTSLFYGVGSSNSYKIAHGTNTLNVLGGTPTSNKLGGLCKFAKILPASTFFNSSTNDYREAALVNIVAKSTTSLKIGDIILLEIEIDGLLGYVGKFPVEVESGYFNAIKDAVTSNFIVIEAAGNGNIDLDSITGQKKYTDNKYKPIRNAAEGTGAIMVGAIQRNGSAYIKHIDSNYGGRIDCYCIGENTNTTAGTMFNDTSLASAIIASLVANMQIKAKNRGTQLTLTTIKNYLKPTLISTSNPYVLPNNGNSFISLYP